MRFLWILCHVKNLYSIIIVVSENFEEQNNNLHFNEKMHVIIKYITLTKEYYTKVNTKDIKDFLVIMELLADFNFMYVVMNSFVNIWKNAKYCIFDVLCILFCLLFILKVTHKKLYVSFRGHVIYLYASIWLHFCMPTNIFVFNF